MRVLVVTTWYPTPSSPSTGVFVARDVAALAGRHDVRVLHLVAPSLAGGSERSTQDPGYAVAPGSEGVPRPGGVPVERLVMDPRRPDHVLRARRRVRELTAGADLLHTMAVSALLPMAGRRPGVPWVHTEHWSGLDAPETLSPPLRAARLAVRPLLRGPDVVVVVGDELAAGVRALRQGPVVLVPNIVEVPGATVPRRLADQDLADRGPLELVGVGGLIDRKDPLRAVDTAAELRRRGVDARLTWVGEGHLRQAVETRASAAQVPLRLAGALPPAQVWAVLGESDVFLLPTRAETFCVAAAEALAAGRPVVVGDSGGPRAFVRPPAGRLVTPGAPAAEWADAVEEVWRGSADLSAVEIGADVRERYGAGAYADRVEEVYRGLVPDRPDDATPEVDVVIAVHDPRRRTERAVRSVLDGSGDVRVRVTVVCHDLPRAEVEASLTAETLADDRVRLLEHRDGIPSPSGPFTAGLEAATAPWVSIMGSDDRLSPGAVPHWLSVARDTGAEVVLAQVQLDGATVATPPTRVRPRAALRRRPGQLEVGVGVRRRSDLDLVRDRLSYRSAPLGLLSREAVERTGARLLPGAQVGEDVPFVTRLFTGARVALAHRAPYVVGTDADDRTTYVPRPVREQLVAVTALLDDPWLASRPARERTAVAVKLLRIHVFGAVLTRTDPSWWTPQERADLAAVTRRLLDAAGDAAGALSLADHDLLRALLDLDVPASTLIDLARARRRHGTPRTLLPRDWRRALDREAPLRFMVASLAARR